MRGVSHDVYAENVRQADGAWLRFPGELSTLKSAKTTANLLRRKFPDLEVTQSQGEIHARLRRES